MLMGVLILMLQGCAGPAGRCEMAQQLASDAGWSARIDSTQQFDIAVFSPPPRKGETLVAYLEGDGRAYLSADTVSTDPTPGDPVALRLALADRRPYPLVYLARPCQYTLAQYGRHCSSVYWTTHRYASSIADSVGEALDQEKKRVGARRLLLVGYSGGGALAVILAQRRADVAAVVTVAANLDLDYWTRRDGLAPLSGSIDPARNAPAISNLPQLHLAAGKDEVVGADVTMAFLRHLPNHSEADPRLLLLPDADHGCCWVAMWPQLLTHVRLEQVFKAAGLNQ